MGSVALAAGKGWRRLIIEVDSETVLKALTRPDAAIPRQIKPFIQETRWKKQLHERLQVSLVSRAADSCANCIAQWYRNRLVTIDWGDEYSIFFMCSLREGCERKCKGG